MLDLLSVLYEGVVPTTQPIRQLFRVAIHLLAEVNQIESTALLVPSQLPDQVVGTGCGIEADELDDLRLITQLRLHTMLPVPDGGGGDADDFSNFFLEQTEFKAVTAEVIAEGDGGG